MTDIDKHEAIGEQLVKHDYITQEDLEEARAREKESGTPWYRQLIQMRKVNFGVFENVLRYEFHSKSARQEQQTLGRTLVELDAISEEQLRRALAEQKKNGRLLGNILLDKGYVTRQAISIALSKQYGMEYADLQQTPSDPDALDAVPIGVARKNEFIPVGLEDDRLIVLVSTPQSGQALRDTGVLLRKRIHPVLTTVDDIEEEIEARYKGKRGVAKAGTKRPKTTKAKDRARHEETQAPESETPKRKARKSKKEEAEEVAGPKNTEDVDVYEEEHEEEEGTDVEVERFEDIAREAAGLPVIKLVNTIIEGAVNSGATDIHLDPQEPEVRVRYRIDGVLHDVMSLPQDAEQAVISRIKIMSDMDITETRRPQDGHISLEIDEMEYDVRVATMPCYLGERVVLRLLDQTTILAGIKDLGLESDDEKKLVHAISEPYGMILVTGPTGSGKTTTLYACLNQKNVMTDSIVTLEDPVEYQLSGINQVQIDTDVDLTFANTLRAALRQDIDVLLVGEIRDPETARIAIRASMTGHLVFSTLHTNDAPEAISTLRNMDIPSYLVSNALTAVVGQRLVRKICEECKTHYTPNKTLLKSLGLPESTKRLYKGKGCESCYHTGYRGRTGVFEVIEVTPQIRNLIANDESTDKIAKAAKLKTMRYRCREKVKKGLITAEEFLKTIRT